MVGTITKVVPDGKRGARFRCVLVATLLHKLS